MKKIAIIGSGLGGLSAAVRLSNLGHQVDIYEKNPSVGGKAGVFEMDGFRFDTGPSLLTMPFVFENLFKDAGENLSDYLKFERLSVLCKYFWQDKTDFNFYSDIERLEQEFADKIPSCRDTEHRLPTRYFEYSKRIYDLTADIFLFNSLSEKSTFLKWKTFKSLLQIYKADIFRSMNAANKSFFKDPKLVQLFNRYATYNGSSPFKSPATLNLIPYVEYGFGGYSVDGGIYEIPQAFEKLALKKGVSFHFNAEVKNIVVEDNIVKGISFLKDSNLQKVDYDVVISNADVNFTYKNLLNDSASKSAKKYSQLEPSSSAIVFLWGVKGEHKNLDIHNILFSENYEKEFDDIFEKKVVPEDPTVYINISSKYCKKDAPEGSENWFVLINVPYNSGQNWADEVDKVKQRIIRKVNKVLDIDLADNIVCEKVLTPVDLEKNTFATHGSIYGISSNSKFAAFLRQSNKSKEYKGLYFCGGSAHPGGGMPLVTLSGKITADLIKKYNPKS